MATEDTVFELYEAAIKAAARAHVPHSGFPVGAAAVTDDGMVWVGCNVESDSFGLTICAERNVMQMIKAQGGGNIEHIAVVCPDVDGSENPKLVMPCGACRQVMSELAPDALIHIYGVGSFTVEQLLPMAFSLS